MENNFYGGRQGASFILKTNFPSIAEMVAAFKKGGSYTDVNYGEYVLIDTENKNDPDNGKLYRRGYNYNNDTGGAEYLGQIVGASGAAPTIYLKDYDTVASEVSKYPISSKDGSKPTIVPGKDGSTYNDEIKWAWYSVRDANGKDSELYLGFSFPYHIIEFDANSVNAYYNRDNNTANFTNQNLVSRLDDASHPYYQKWKISIPKGIKGESGNNFRVMAATSEITDYTGKSDDVSSGRQVLVYDQYNYDKTSGGDKQTIYLGDYNQLKNFTIADDGTITIQYTHDNTDTYNKLIKYLKSMSLSDDGKLSVVYNTEPNTSIELKDNIKWIDSTSLDDAGTLAVNYNNGTKNTFINKVKWITNFEVADDGTITVTYNNKSAATALSKKIKWITGATLDNNGNLEIKYNNGDSSYKTQLTWPTGITVADDGTVTIAYTNQASTVYNNYVKAIADVQIDTGSTEGEGTQKVQVTYNTNSTPVSIGNPINYIMKTVMTDDDFHLLVLYSDPAKRKEIIAAGENRTYDGRNDWYDLGSIKAESGILIGLNLAYSYFDDKTNSTIITKLNKDYPNGLPSNNIDLFGKIITVGGTTDNKKFFAFDYQNFEWYYIGSIGESTTSSVLVGAEDDSLTINKSKDLPEGSVWLILEEE